MWVREAQQNEGKRAARGSSKRRTKVRLKVT
jgi:hypothetical protein